SSSAAGAQVHRQVGDVLAAELDASAVRHHQPDAHVEAGGLAGTVGAEQADDLAAVDGQRRFPHHLAPAIAFGELASNQLGHRPSSLCCSLAPSLAGWMTMRTRCSLPSADSAVTVSCRVS